MMTNHIRGIRQGVSGGTTGYVLGRQPGNRGPVTAIPIPGGQGASASATAGGMTPQSQTTGSFVNFNPTGAWDAATAYDPGDVVTDDDAAYVNYVAIAAPGPNPAPGTDAAHWLSQGDVRGPGASTVGNVATYDNVTGSLLADTGVALDSLAPLAAPTFTGTVTITDILALLPVAAPSSPASGWVAYTDVADGKVKLKSSAGVVVILTP